MYSHPFLDTISGDTISLQNDAKIAAIPLITRYDFYRTR